MEIGKRIKRYRKKNSLTLEELANRTELTKGFLSQLENDLTSPSIATLSDITEALGVSLEEFFASDKEEQVVFSQEDFFVNDNPDYKIHWVVPNAQKNEMEPILLELKPGGVSQEVSPHNGQEFGYVLSGKVYLQTSTAKQLIKKGETFYLTGNQTHSLVNASQSKGATLLWICTPPIF